MSGTSEVKAVAGLRSFYLLGFVALMVIDTLAQLSFKLAGEHALPLELSAAWLVRVFGQPWIYGALFGYLGAFFIWLTLLEHAPIGPAFAASHLEIVSVLLVSNWLFGERIGYAQLLGGALILAGIGCLAISETKSASSQAQRLHAAPARRSSVAAGVGRGG